MGNDGPIRWTTVTLDCADAETLASFYADLFDWPITARDGHGWVQVRDPRGGVGLNFQAEEGYEPPVWPERPGRASKMMHLEILVEDLASAIEQVCRGGGREAPHQPSDRDATRLRVMLDPAGHPFCLYVSGE